MTNSKRTKGQAAIYKTIHIKLKMGNTNPHKKQEQYALHLCLCSFF